MVSVVIPTFNSERFLRETLETVMSQTYPVSEIVIVDGGSTDKTLRIASEFPVRICPEQSRSIPNGRNIGMRVATSEWIALLDHDDLWEPTKLEKQVESVCQYPDVTMVLTDYVRVDSLKTIRKSEKKTSADYYRAIGRQDGCYFPRVDFTNQEWMIPLTSSCLIKKGTEWFDEELQGTDDTEFFLRMMMHPFVSIDIPLVHWRMTPTSYSHKEKLSMELDFVKTMDTIMTHPERYPAGVYDCVRRIRGQRIRQVSFHLLKNRKVLVALSMLRRSFVRGSYVDR